MAVWELDIGADKVIGSPELNRLLGFSEDSSPTAEDMRARYFPGERERLKALGKAALARGESTLDAEYRYLWPDGSIRWLWLRAEFVMGPDDRPAHAIGVLTDVTERKQSEEALRASETRLKLAQQAAGFGVWDWDVRTGELNWSPEMFSILGLDPELQSEARYEAWLNALHPEDRDQADQAAKRCASLGEPFDVHFRIHHRPTDEERWVRSHGVALLDVGGEPLRVFGINADVTEEKRREQELQALAGDLREAVAETTKTRDRIFELSNDLFAVAGFDGYLKTVNPAWERLLGYTEATLLSRPFAEFIHPSTLR